MATVSKLNKPRPAPRAPRKRGLGDIATGASGPEVEDLQRALQLAGYTTVQVTGMFDGLTQAAVVDAQQKAGRPGTGIVDDATWDLILARSEGSSVPGKNPTIYGEQIDITGRVPATPKFFLFDPAVPLWKKALAVGGTMAVLGILFEALNNKNRQPHTFAGYEKALNEPPRCRGNRPPSVDLEDAELLEVEG